MTGYPLAKLMKLGLPGSVPPIVLMLAVSPLTESRIGDRDWGDDVCIKHKRPAISRLAIRTTTTRFRIQISVSPLNESSKFAERLLRGIQW